MPRRAPPTATASRSRRCAWRKNPRRPPTPPAGSSINSSECFDMIRYFLTCSFLAVLVVTARADDPKGPADLIVHNAKVLTVDAKFSVVKAVAVKDGRVLATGDDDTVLKLKGPKTRLIDAGGRTVLPGLYDSHVHSVDAAVSELK